MKTYKPLFGVPGARWLAFLLGTGLAEGLSSAQTNAPHLWQPMPDAPYLQEIGQRIVTPEPIVSVAVDRGVAVLRGMALTNLRGADGLPYEDTTCLAAGRCRSKKLTSVRFVINIHGSAQRSFSCKYG